MIAERAASIHTLLTRAERPSYADIALWLTATEALPAGWHDLSALASALNEPRGEHAGTRLSPYECEILDYLTNMIDRERIRWWTERLERLGYDTLEFVACIDPHYPTNLAHAFNRPPWLFVRGNLKEVDSRAIAVVGSRDAATKCLTATTDVVEGLVADSFTIISGLAEGVDRAAHKAALDFGGRTLAVVGSSIDHAFAGGTSDNLRERIREQGAVLSPFFPGAPATRSSLPLRNGVISALANGTVVMDVREFSGTRTEIEHSLAQGRPVCIWRQDPNAEAWLDAWAANSLVHFVDDVSGILALVTSWTRLR